MVVSQWFMQTWRKLGDFGNWSSDVLEYLAPEPLKMSRCLKHTESCIFFQRYSNNSIERWHYMDQDEADSLDATLGGSWEYANESASWPTCNCWIEHQESQDKKGHLQGMSWQKVSRPKRDQTKKADLQRGLDKNIELCPLANWFKSTTLADFLEEHAIAWFFVRFPPLFESLSWCSSREICSIRNVLVHIEAAIKWKGQQGGCRREEKERISQLGWIS